MTNQIYSHHELPLVVIVGRFNVGKSSLFNALAKKRLSIVADEPGVTQDRIYAEVDFDDKPAFLVDTGGLTDEKNLLKQAIAAQTQLAIEAASLVIFVVDAKSGLNTEDQTIAAYLRKKSTPIVLVLNKMDHRQAEENLSEFYRLGFDAVFPVSAEAKTGLEKLIAYIAQQLPKTLRTTPTEVMTRIAIIGRPNVGKSTLTNRILGEARTIVSEMPGTTRDPVSVPFHYKDHMYELIDTAGIRRKRSVQEKVEQFSVIQSLKTIAQADIIIFILDSHEGLTDQDLRLLDLIKQEGKGLIIAFNKWDGLDLLHKQTLKEFLENKLKFVDYAPRCFISAKHGTGVGELLVTMNQIAQAQEFTARTSNLTQLLEKAIALHSPPMVKGRRIKLRYAHLGAKKPPTIIIHGNQTEALPVAYKRYLNNFFREKLNIFGVPLRLVFKTGQNPFDK